MPKIAFQKSDVITFSCVFTIAQSKIKILFKFDMCVCLCVCVCVSVCVCMCVLFVVLQYIFRFLDNSKILDFMAIYF